MLVRMCREQQYWASLSGLTRILNTSSFWFCILFGFSQVDVAYHSKEIFILKRFLRFHYHGIVLFCDIGVMKYS